MKKYTNKFNQRIIFSFIIVFFTTFCVGELIDAKNLETFSSIGKFDLGIGGVINSLSETPVLQQDGKGVVSYFQFNADYEHYEETIFRIYIDGENEASIEAKLFHLMYRTQNSFIGTNSKSSFYFTIPIPFSSSIKITVQADPNFCNHEPQMVYWTIRGTLNTPLVINGIKYPNDAKLKIYNHDRQLVFPFEYFSIAKSKENESINGAIILTQVALESSRYDYLEGPLRITSNGLLHYLSTGIDDYVSSAWWFSQSFGNHFTEELGGVVKRADPGEFVFYRIHLNDPIFWKNSFNLEIRNGDVSIEGYSIGEPDLLLLSSRIWTYEWN